MASIGPGAERRRRRTTDRAAATPSTVLTAALRARGGESEADQHVSTLHTPLGIPRPHRPQRPAAAPRLKTVVGAMPVTTSFPCNAAHTTRSSAGRGHVVGGQRRRRRDGSAHHRADAVDSEIHASVCGDSTMPNPGSGATPAAVREMFRDPDNERAPSRRGGGAARGAMPVLRGVEDVSSTLAAQPGIPRAPTTPNYGPR